MIFAIGMIWIFTIRPILIFNIKFILVYVILVGIYIVYLIIKKKITKPKIITKKIIKPLIVVLIASDVMFLWWFNHPYIGYSKEYKQSGNAISPSEVYVCGNGINGNWPMTTTPCTLETGDYPTQKDYELQKRDITKMYNLKHPVYEKEDIEVELTIDEQDINRDFSDLPYWVKISGGGGETVNYSNKEYVELNNHDFDQELNFENTENIENIKIRGTYINNMDDTLRLNWDGVENLETIDFWIYTAECNYNYIYEVSYKKIYCEQDECYKKRIPSELDILLHDFGYLDKDGYYGEVYDKPDEVLKEPNELGQSCKEKQEEIK